MPSPASPPGYLRQCHEEKVTQFKKGKHAIAWAAMKAMPTASPACRHDGRDESCGGCHKLGLKSETEMRDLQKAVPGSAAPPATPAIPAYLLRHRGQTAAGCQTCHMGFDHPQWEMYSASKHGVRFLLKQNKTLPKPSPLLPVRPATCRKGTTRSGPLGLPAVRLPMPEDKQWTADRPLSQGLGVLDRPGIRRGGSMSSRRGRGPSDQESWQAERDKMIKTCNQCHSLNFAKASWPRETT